MQLQDQHFQQYMQQVHDQMVLHQRQQYAQMQTLASNGQTETDVTAIIPMMTSLDVDQQLIQYMTETEGGGDDKDRETDDSYATDHESEHHSSLTSDTKEKLIVAENVTDDTDGYRNIDEDDEEDDDQCK